MNVMSIFPEVNTAHVISFYADNEMYCRELRICLSSQDWCEFSSEEFYQGIIEFLHKKGIQENMNNPDSVQD